MENDNSENRRLSADEQKRKSFFDAVVARLTAEGYTRKNLTTTAIKGNVYGTLGGVVAAVPFAVGYVLKNGMASLHGDSANGLAFFIMLIGGLVSIVIHEFIHGFTWSRFTPHGFKDVAFGIILEALTPYCSCREPLRKGQYIAGCVMPCIVLGIIPTLVSIFIANPYLFFYGIFMIVCAGGDLLIFSMILNSKLKDTDLFLDHPTDIGLVVFTKE